MQHLPEGSVVPDVPVRVREGDGWQVRQSRELFGNRTVVLFALPGAFTPTCSSSHLPRYEELAHLFEKAGVDAIYCLSVNDTFVMEAWGRDQCVDKVRLLADGNGAFSAAMGMLVDKEDLGFGKRSWRYAMIVRNGAIERLFVEPERPGDPFEVSDADTVLGALSPGFTAPEPVAILTRPGCPHCARAKRLLTEQGRVYDEIVLGRDATSRSLAAIAGRTSVPQVFIGGRHIGGADDLEAYFARGASAS
jgi:glutathione-dependent peroxiredoxin